MHSNQKSNEQKESTAKSQLITPPSINLPKGGGASYGISEKSAINRLTGTDLITIIIASAWGNLCFFYNCRFPMMLLLATVSFVGASRYPLSTLSLIRENQKFNMPLFLILE